MGALPLGRGRGLSPALLESPTGGHVRGGALARSVRDRPGNLPHWRETARNRGRPPQEGPLLLLQEEMPSPAVDGQSGTPEGGWTTDPRRDGRSSSWLEPRSPTGWQKWLTEQPLPRPKRRTEPPSADAQDRRTGRSPHRRLASYHGWQVLPPARGDHFPMSHVGRDLQPGVLSEPSVGCGQRH